MVNTTFLAFKKPVQYPIIEEDIGRVQIQYESGHYALLLFNDYLDIWCVYTVVSQSQAQIVESKRLPLGISYVAPAGRPITWMRPAEKNKKLMHMTHVLEDLENGDFWVGRHLEPNTDKLVAILHAGRLCIEISEALNVDSSVRGQAGNYAGIRGTVVIDDTLGGVSGPSHQSSQHLEAAEQSSSVGDSKR